MKGCIARRSATAFKSHGTVRSLLTFKRGTILVVSVPGALLWLNGYVLGFIGFVICAGLTLQWVKVELTLNMNSVHISRNISTGKS
jgi:hypothetical protein